MVFYADNTMVFYRSNEVCEELLDKIEIISKEYGLKLNRDKYVKLNIYTDEQQTFRGGTKNNKGR